MENKNPPGDWPTKIFIGFANSLWKPTVGDRRFTSTMYLTLIMVLYLMFWGVLLQRHGVMAVKFIADLWPWQSDNFRSFKSKGTGFMVCVGGPFLLFWWKIGNRANPWINAASGSNLFLIIILAGILVLTIVSIILKQSSDLPALAVLINTIALTVLGTFCIRKAK